MDLHGRICIAMGVQDGMRKDTHECEEREVSILFHARILRTLQLEFRLRILLYLLLYHIDDGINVLVIRHTTTVSHRHCRLLCTVGIQIWGNHQRHFIGVMSLLQATTIRSTTTIHNVPKLPRLADTLRAFIIFTWR
jgi:hypothetical protein